MNAYWNKHPPLHLMVADFMGIKPSNTQSRASTGVATERCNTKQDLESFMQAFGAAGGKLG